MIRAAHHPGKANRLSATQAPGDRGGAGAAIGLDHVAIDHDLALAEGMQIDYGTQRTPDQALDLLGASGGLAGIHLAAGALMRGARQHGVFCRHLSPCPSRASQGGPALFEGGSAEHLGLTEGNEARALRIALRHRARG